MSEIYEDGFGNEYIISEGEIKVGDMALNGDTGDVIYIDEEDDLFLRLTWCQGGMEMILSTKFDGSTVYSNIQAINIAIS